MTARGGWGVCNGQCARQWAAPRNARWTYTGDAVQASIVTATKRGWGGNLQGDNGDDERWKRTLQPHGAPLPPLKVMDEISQRPSLSV